MIRCTRCGEKPHGAEVDLVLFHEMCRRCREDDLREQAAHIKADLSALADDLNKTEFHTNMPDSLVAEINTLVAALKETSGV